MGVEVYKQFKFLQYPNCARAVNGSPEHPRERERAGERREERTENRLLWSKHYFFGGKRFNISFTLQI